MQTQPRDTRLTGATGKDRPPGATKPWHKEPVIFVAEMRNNAINAKEFRYEEMGNNYDGSGIEAVHNYGSGLRMPQKSGGARSALNLTTAAI